MQLHVKVDRVLYPREADTEQFKDAERGVFHIIKTHKHGVAKGSMHWRPEENENLVLEGQYGEYKGQREFRFTTAVRDMPVSAEAKLAYVCERTPGCGEAMRKRIWEEWGEDWEDAAEPGRVKRLDNKLWQDFRSVMDDFKIKAEEAETIAWLQGKGATMAIATAAWTKWGTKTTGVIENNVYRLADLPNYGFTHADALRTAFDIADDDMRRIRAATMYAVRQLTDDGSTVVTWSEVEEQALSILRGYRTLICEAVRQMFADGDLQPWPGTMSISTVTDFKYEKTIWEYVS